MCAQYTTVYTLAQKYTLSHTHINFIIKVGIPSRCYYIFIAPKSVVAVAPVAAAARFHLDKIHCMTAWKVKINVGLVGYYYAIL